jgi:hypothetical protein
MPWKNQYLAPVVSNARYAQYTFDVLTLGHAVLNEARDGPLRYRPMLVRYYVISVRQSSSNVRQDYHPRNTCDEHVTCDTGFHSAM